MRNLINIILLSLSLFSFAQTKPCTELKGTWYFSLMHGAKEPIYLIVTDCTWNEYGNPMGNRKGTIEYSIEKKQFEIIGLSEASAGKVYLNKFKNVYYLAWTSYFTDERVYLVLTREKKRGYWYDEFEKILKANNK